MAEGFTLETAHNNDAVPSRTPTPVEKISQNIVAYFLRNQTIHPACVIKEQLVKTIRVRTTRLSRLYENRWIQFLDDVATSMWQNELEQDRIVRLICITRPTRDESFTESLIDCPFHAASTKYRRGFLLSTCRLQSRFPFFFFYKTMKDDPRTNSRPDDAKGTK